MKITHDDKYCGYLRKSRADQEAEIRGEGETLARHKQILLECADRMHIKIERFYSEVVSGETIADRPAMQQLLSEVEAGLWKGVFVVEVERLARGNTKDQGIVADAFKYSSTKIITPSKIYDPDNEFDEEYFEFGLFMSRREYKTINRRLQRGRVASVKEGNYIASTAPYGYRKVRIPNGKGYTLEVNSEQAEIVRKIFEWYCYGDILPDGSTFQLGTDAIAAKLDMLGIKPSINEKWSRASLSDMLQNITYTGMVCFGKRKEVKTSVNGNIVKMRKSSDNYTMALGKHEAIISEDLFHLAQRLRQKNRKNTLPSTSRLQNPLSGIVYCKKCGHLMTRLAPNSRNRYSTIKCPNRYCDNVSSPLFLVENQILAFLNDWLKTYEVNNNTLNTIPLKIDMSEKDKLLNKIDNDIATVQKQLNKAYDLLEQGVYTIDIFKQRQEILTNDIHILSENKKLLSDEIKQIDRLKRERELMIPKVQHLLDTYASNSVATNNQILKEVISKVYYEKDEPNRRGNLNNASFLLSIFPNVPI